MEVLIFATLIGLIPAAIAKSKGRSFGLWWLYGASLFIVALPHSLLMKADRAELEKEQLSDGMKKCPYCAELIKREAIVCRHCGKDLGATKNSPSHNKQKMEEYGITFDGEHYVYDCGKFEMLSDAIDYAKQMER